MVVSDTNSFEGNLSVEESYLDLQTRLEGMSIHDRDPGSSARAGRNRVYDALCLITSYDLQHPERFIIFQDPTTNR